MTQTRKGARKSKKSDTVRIFVAVPPSLEEQSEVRIESWLPRITPQPVDVAVDTLKNEIDKFITQMLPIMDGLPAPQSDKAGVDSLALALAVTASGQVGIAGVVTGGLQAQASITVTFAKKKAP